MLLHNWLRIPLLGAPRIQTLLLLAVIASIGCGDAEGNAVSVTDDAPHGPPTARGGSALSLIGTCTFVQKSGTMTVPVNPGETIILSKRSVDSAILVQGATCDDTSTSPAVPATSRNVKIINVRADTPSGNAVDLSSSSEFVIIDIQNGAYGLASSPGYGVFVDLGGGGDEVDLIGSASPEKLGCSRISGKDNLGLKSVTSADVKVTGHTGDKFLIDLGSGDDSFDKGNCVTQLDVYGGAGKDTFLVGTDTSVTGDHFHGGADVDTISYASRTRGVVAAADGTTPSGDPTSGGEQDLLEPDIENIIGGSGDDRLVASSATNIKHLLTGGDGNDTLISSKGGATTFTGGNGIDTVDYSSRQRGIVVTMGDGTANDGESQDHDNIGQDVENLIGSGYDDSLTGNAKSNVIVPGLGNDRVNGGDGDDTIVAGSAIDGIDTYNGGKGADTVDYSARAQGICAVLDGASPSGDCTFLMGEAAMNVTPGDADKIASDVECVVGTTGADHLVGNSLGNVLIGLGGADWLEGKLGDDQLDANLYTSGGANVCNPITFACIGSVNGTCDCKTSSLSATCSQSALLQCGGDPLDLAACHQAAGVQFEGCWRTQ